MKTRYYLRLPDPGKARGSDPDLSFHSAGADGFAAEFEKALREPGLFERWRDRQEDPDAVPVSLGVVDPEASVHGTQHDLSIDLIATTSLPGNVFKHRLRLLAGGAWELRDVRAG